MTTAAISPMMRNVLTIAKIPPMAVKTPQMATTAPTIFMIIRPMHPGYPPRCRPGGRSVTGQAADPFPDEAGVTVAPPYPDHPDLHALADDCRQAILHADRRDCTRLQAIRAVSCCPARTSQGLPGLHIYT